MRTRGLRASGCDSASVIPSGSSRMTADSRSSCSTGQRASPMSKRPASTASAISACHISQVRTRTSGSRSWTAATSGGSVSSATVGV